MRRSGAVVEQCLEEIASDGPAPVSGIERHTCDTPSDLHHRGTQPNVTGVVKPYRTICDICDNLYLE